MLFYKCPICGEFAFIQPDLSTEERARAFFDRYLRGEITLNELHHFLQALQPKPLKARTEFIGYV